MENVSLSKNVMRDFGSGKALLLAVAGLLLFLASLLLPAVRVVVLSGPVEFNGLQASAWAVGLGIGSLAHSENMHTPTNPKHLLLGAVGLLNFLFLIAPFALRTPVLNKLVSRLLAAGSMLGIALGILAPVALVDFPVTPMIGYFSWLLGYILLMVAIFIAPRE